MGPFWEPFWGQNGLQNGSKTGSFLGPVFGPVFVDFEILVGRPAVARGYTLSGKVPRAASRAVLLTNYQASREHAIYQASNGSDTPWPKGRRIFGMWRPTILQRPLNEPSVFWNQCSSKGIVFFILGRCKDPRIGPSRAL